MTKRANHKCERLGDGEYGYRGFEIRRVEMDNMYTGGICTYWVILSYTGDEDQPYADIGDTFERLRDAKAYVDKLQDEMVSPLFC